MTHATALFLTAALLIRPGADGSGGSQVHAADALLDLPYLTQTEQLCGGAAIAMVFRYWGTRNVFPEDFAALVDDRERGIRTSVLADAVVRRGWRTVTALPDPAADGLDWLRAQVRLGRPVIVLVEERPRVYHYVVVAGVTDTSVVFHDPARRPYRVMPREEFDVRWHAAGRWLLLALPPPEPSPTHMSSGPVTVSPTTPSPEAPCQALVSASVTQAREGEAGQAEHGLLAATRLCPDASEGWLELAGLRFVQQRYEEASVFASEAIARNPSGEDAWRILGTTSFLAGDLVRALSAWNHLGEPTTDTVSVEGVTRTPHPVIVEATGLQPRELLSASAFARAERRLRELPIAQSATLRYHVASDGTAAVTAVVLERPIFATGATALGALLLNTAIVREVTASFFGLAGQGDEIEFAYRFRHNRPRVRAAFIVPAPGRMPGQLSIETMWDRQSYGFPAPDAPDVLLVGAEERRRSGVRWSDWGSGSLRWQLGAALDRFEDNRFLSLDASVNTRWLNDHVSITGSAGLWTAGTPASFSSGEISGAWRSSRAPGGWGWTARSGLAAVGSAAPLAIWPLASSSSSRGALLRGHRLYEDGIITTDTLGRTLAYNTLEHSRQVWTNPAATVGVAGFVDIVRVWDRTGADDPSRWEFDIGVGARLGTPTLGGQLRFDAGYAIRPGSVSLSAGYVVPWGS